MECKDKDIIHDNLHIYEVQHKKSLWHKQLH